MLWNSKLHNSHCCVRRRQ